MNFYASVEFIIIIIIIIIIYYYLLLESFTHKRKMIIFHWSLSDSKSPQVSWTLFSERSNLVLTW